MPYSGAAHPRDLRNGRRDTGGPPATNPSRARAYGPWHAQSVLSDGPVEFQQDRLVGRESQESKRAGGQRGRSSLATSGVCVLSIWWMLVFASLVFGADDGSASKPHPGSSVLLVTFEAVDDPAVQAPEGPGWSVSRAVPGSNRPGRALFGLLSGIAPALVEGEVQQVPRDVLIAHRLLQRSGASTAWVPNRERERVRTVRSFVPEITRYRRLRSVVRDLEEAREVPGFYWVDVAEPMGVRSANTVERLARALGDRPTMVVATTLEADALGSVPLWVRDPDPSRGTEDDDRGSGAPFSLESVGAAMQAHVLLTPSPVAAGAWPRVEISLVEHWRDGRPTLTARRGQSMVSVAWQPGNLAACWLHDATEGECRWTRSSVRGDGTVETLPVGISGDAGADAAFRELENHLLWALERRLE